MSNVRSSTVDYYVSTGSFREFQFDATMKSFTDSVMMDGVTRDMLTGLSNYDATYAFKDGVVSIEGNKKHVNNLYVFDYFLAFDPNKGFVSHVRGVESNRPSIQPSSISFSYTDTVDGYSEVFYEITLSGANAGVRIFKQKKGNEGSTPKRASVWIDFKLPVLHPDARLGYASKGKTIADKNALFDIINVLNLIVTDYRKVLLDCHENNGVYEKVTAYRS